MSTQDNVSKAVKVLFPISTENGDVQIPILGEVVSFDGITDVKRDKAIELAKAEGLDSSVFKNISKKNAFIRALRQHKTDNLITYVDGKDNEEGLIRFQFDKKVIETLGEDMVARFERVTSIVYDTRSDIIVCDDDMVRDFVYQRLAVTQETYSSTQMFGFLKKMVEQECGDRLLRLREAGSVYFVRAAASDKLHKIVNFITLACPTMTVNLIPMVDTPNLRTRMKEVVVFESNSDIEELEKEMKKIELDGEGMSSEQLDGKLVKADAISSRLMLYSDMLETKFENVKTLVESFKLTAEEFRNKNPKMTKAEVAAKELSDKKAAEKAKLEAELAEAERVQKEKDAKVREEQIKIANEKLELERSIAELKAKLQSSSLKVLTIDGETKNEVAPGEVVNPVATPVVEVPVVETSSESIESQLEAIEKVSKKAKKVKKS